MANVHAQATTAAAPVSLASFNFAIPALLPLMLAALVVRLLLAGIPGFGVDMGTFQAWSQDLATNHPWNFYQEDKFTDYAPGYMYVLWLIGEIHQIVTFNADQYEYVLKLPSIAADLASAYLLYKMLDKKGPATQLGVTVAYLFFPAALWIGAFWGQVDSILAFFLLLTVYFIGRDKPVAGAVAFAIGFLVKPQAIAALPFLAFWIMRRYPPLPRAERQDILLAMTVAAGIAATFAWRLLAAPDTTSGGAGGPGISAAEDFFGSTVSLIIPVGFTAAAVLYLLRNPAAGTGSGPLLRMPPKVWIECAVYPLLVVLILITPFFKLEPWNLFDVLAKATNVENYRVNSFWAYNFWNTGGIFKMGFHCDIDSACQQGQQASEFLGLDTRYWSVILFTSAIVMITAILRNARGTGFLALGTALSVLAFYMLLTRMHERYVFAFFLPFLLACALIHSRALWSAFVVTSVVHFLNLYHVFGYYYVFAPDERDRFPDFLRWRWLYSELERTPFLGIDFPVLGVFETTQALSVIFVASFVALLAAAFYLAEGPAPPGDEKPGPVSTAEAV